MEGTKPALKQLEALWISISTTRARWSRFSVLVRSYDLRHDRHVYCLWQYWNLRGAWRLQCHSCQASIRHSNKHWRRYLYHNYIRRGHDQDCVGSELIRDALEEGSLELAKDLHQIGEKSKVYNDDGIKIGKRSLKDFSTRASSEMGQEPLFNIFRRKWSIPRRRCRTLCWLHRERSLR